MQVRQFDQPGTRHLHPHRDRAATYRQGNVVPPRLLMQRFLWSQSTLPISALPPFPLLPVCWQREERPVVITVEGPSNLAVRVDSKAFVDTLGMMGEKMVEISPGKKAQPLLAPGATIEGEDPIPMHEMMGNLHTLTGEMMTMSASLNPMIKQLNDLMQKNAEMIQSTLEHVHGTTKGLDHILNGNQEQIGKIIANLQETSSNVRDLTTDLKTHPWRLVRKG